MRFFDQHTGLTNHEFFPRNARCISLSLQGRSRSVARIAVHKARSNTACHCLPSTDGRKGPAPDREMHRAAIRHHSIYGVPVNLLRNLPIQQSIFSASLTGRRKYGMRAGLSIYLSEFFAKAEQKKTVAIPLRPVGTCRAGAQCTPERLMYRYASHGARAWIATFYF